MAVELATGYVSITASAKGIARSITSELGGDVDKAGNDAGRRAAGEFTDRFRLGLSGIAAAVGGAFAAVQVGGFLKDAVSGASDLGESVSKINVVFGESAAEVVEWSKTTATSIGQSQQQALEAAGTFGNLFRAMGIGAPTSQELSTELVTLASDLASFNNASPDDVLLALRSGLTGEIEPLRRFGVNLNDARIKAEALSLGLLETSVDMGKLSTAQERVEKAQRKVAKALKEQGEGSTEYSDAVRDQTQAEANLERVLAGKVGELDAAAKAQAAYSLITQDTALAQGDFERTSGGLANQSRILTAQFANLKASIGTALLPVVTRVVSALNDRLLPALAGIGGQVGPFVARFADLFVGVASAVGSELIGGVKAFVAAFRTGDSEVTSSGIPGVLERIGGLVRNVVDFISGIDWRAAFGAAVGFLRPIADVLLKIIRIGIDVVGVIGNELVGGVKAFVAAFRTGDGEVTSSGIPGVLERIGGFARVIADVAIVIGNELVGGVKAFVAAFKAGDGEVTSSGIPGVLERIGGLVRNVVDFISGIDWRAAFGAAVGFITPIADALFNVARAGADFVTQLLEGVVPRTAAIVAGIAAAIGDNWDTIAAAALVVRDVLAGAFEVIAKVVSFIADNFDVIGPILLGAATAFGVLAVAAATYSAIQTVVAAGTAAYAAVQAVLNAVLAANPIGIVVIAIGALAGGLFVAYRKSEQFRAAVDATGRFLRDKLWPALKDVAAVVATVAAAVGGFLLDAFRKVAPVFAAAAAVVFDLAKVVGGFLLDRFQELWPVVQTVAGVLFDLAQLVGGFLLDKFQELWPLIRDGAAVLFDLAVAVGTSVVEAIKTGIDFVGKFIDKARDIIGTVTDVATTVKTKFDEVVSFVSGLPGRITAAAAGMWDGIKEAFRAAINFVIDGWNSLRLELPEVDTHIPGVGKIGGWALDTPDIPRLAHGGVITSTTLALLGETPSARPEIVAPEALLRDIFRSELDAGRPIVQNVSVTAPSGAGRFWWEELQGEMRWQAVNARQALTRGV